jgi:hypothetical protein
LHELMPTASVMALLVNPTNTALTESTTRDVQWQGSGQPGGTKLVPPVRLSFVLQPEDALSGRALLVCEFTH